MVPLVTIGVSIVSEVGRSRFLRTPIAGRRELMVIRIVGEEQVVYDCQGGTPDKYLAKLLVGITENKDRVTVPVIRSNYDFSLRRGVTSRQFLEFSPHVLTPTE